MNATPDETELTQIFEERAENLSPDELWQWSAETDRDRALLSKLTGTGAKLLSGPRGSGKSTLLRKAFFALHDDGRVVPAYVNFSKSLALEPLFHRRANALQIFRQWVCYKILIGFAESATKRTATLPSDLARLATEGNDYLRALETGASESPPRYQIAPSELLRRLEVWTNQLGATRCVLLLDDAAHAFSPAQQQDFFEVFRALRSRYVAAKAAVYPGITSYSPYFHVGHEAELLVAWYSPDDESYLKVMRDIARKRLPPTLYEAFNSREEILDVLALASFGLPRGYLNMISYTLGVEEHDGARPTRRRADQAIAIHAESVRNVFRALRSQLPRFKNFIDVGLELQRAIAHNLRAFNNGKIPGRTKTTHVGIADPIPTEVKRIIAMAEYAGILRQLGTVSRGTKGVFHKYALHNAIAINENCLSLGKSYKFEDIVKSLSVTNAHSFTKTQVGTLLGENVESRCTLDLAPCQKCGTARPSEDARFCMNCGSELRNVSVYEELINAPIENLPLTKKKIDGILERTRLRTVQDILLDEDSTEIRKVPYIGPVWSARIRNAAQEYVSV